MQQNKVGLIILDGWGYGDKSKADAIHQAKTPFFDSLLQQYPSSQLLASGEQVGLPPGQMGNSEVGHLNIGAGRIVYQDLARINKAIEEKTILANPVLQQAFEQAKNSGSKLHFMGLVSDGGVHSSQEHLHFLCQMAADAGVQNVCVHAFTDGRDTDPKGGLEYMTKLEAQLEKTGGILASMIGRYFAMDRDNRWERVKKAYDMLVHGQGKQSTDLIKDLKESYAQGVTDEFIEPIVRVGNDGKAVGKIAPNDVVVCFNFRTDRCREITRVLTQQDMEEHQMSKLPLYYVTMTNYDKSFKNIHIVFEKNNLEMTLGETISKAQKKQIRIAETEKYPHVTFFFSGGREIAFEGESRLMINSPKVATYDLQPEMSAEEVTQAILPELQNETADFICLNFANPDMVGHTGVYDAIVKAVEKVDSCTQRVVETGLAHGYSFIIIADHGNADFVINANGTPNTAHTTNPVPCILAGSQFSKIEDGILADVAPTILKMMGIEIPDQMTGATLVS